MLTAQNSLFLYNSLDERSVKNSLYWREIHNASYSNLIPVEITISDEIVSTYSVFYDEVESKILAAINNNVDSYSQQQIICVILGPGFPIGFTESGKTFSTTSRISSIYEDFSPNSKNPNYNRQSLDSISSLDDLNNYLICSQIISNDNYVEDKILKNCEFVNNHKKINGSIFLNRDSSYEKYSSKLESFYSDEVPDYGIRVELLEQNPYLVNVFPKIENDSFFWGEMSYKTDNSFFVKSNSCRIFLYAPVLNNSVLSLNNSEDKSFPQISIEEDYATCSFSLESQTEDNFLNPSVFFDFLNNGFSIGESFLFSNPKLNNSTTLIGDPVISTEFPTFNIEDVIVDLQKWRDYTVNLSKINSLFIIRRQEIESILTLVVLSQDYTTSVDLIDPIYLVLNILDYQYKNNLSENLFNFSSLTKEMIKSLQYSGVNEFLLDNNLMVSDYWAKGSGFSISPSQILDSGYWEHKITIEDIEGDEFYFNIQISESEDFNDILVDVNSSLNSSGWEYKKYTGEYKEFLDETIGMQFIGSSIIYRSSESDYLETNSKYWIRSKQISSYEETDWQVSRILIWA